MNQARLTQKNAQSYELSGELTMQNVPQVAKDTAAMVKAMQGEVVINLSAVARADSAGLVLLIDWLRMARQQDFSLKFEALPEQLMQIARISELDDILPIHHPGQH